MIIQQKSGGKFLLSCASNSNGNGTFGQNVRETTTTTLFNAMNP